MVVFDSTIMLLVMRPDVNAPIDEESGLPVDHAAARINAFVRQLEKEKTKIIIPTPALSEILVKAGRSIQDIVSTLDKDATFRIEPFDTRAAIEAAIMTRKAIETGDKRAGVDSSWAKVKYDRQIVAIAKVHKATTIYSDDRHVRSLGKTAQVTVLGLADLPIPVQEQGELFPTSGSDMSSNDEEESEE